MVSFPNAKINLGLNIVEKRNDGFHNLETIFLPIDISDILEVIIDEEKQFGIEFTSSGLQIAGDVASNLCVKAYNLINNDFKLPAVKLHLHKVIPMGAGLGGGSANGAFALKVLNEKLGLNITKEKLLQYALQLGSDCPFFIENKVCFATSRGEILTAIELDLYRYKILIVNPKIHIPTYWAFNNIVPKKPDNSIQEIIKMPITTWKNELVNDFEKSVLKEHSPINKIKETLYNYGAIYASLTGTGSTVFGIFEKQIENEVFKFPDEYLVKWVNALQ
ncbi:MAG: 4-(cytidine 5'-diphospho)-2-C-methyl-D-erythritol kinase [Chitinophagaceae bacterium]